MRLYDRLFTEPYPETNGKDFGENLSTHIPKTVKAYDEPPLANVPAGKRFQFERHGYFVTDLIDHSEGNLVFNRVPGMKDSFIK